MADVAVATLVPQQHAAAAVNTACAPVVPQMGSSSDAFADEYEDITMNLPFSPLDLSKHAKAKVPPARLSGFDGLFEFAFAGVPQQQQQQHQHQHQLDQGSIVPDVAAPAYGRRSSVLRLAQELQQDARAAPAVVKSEVSRLHHDNQPWQPFEGQAQPNHLGHALAHAQGQGQGHSYGRAFSRQEAPAHLQGGGARVRARARARTGSCAPASKPASMRKPRPAVDTSLLAADHKPARGRGRSKQLAKMTPEQKKAEQAIRMDKNKLAARAFRLRRKGKIQALEQSVAQHEQRTRQQQNTISQLQQEVLRLKQQLASNT